MKLNKQNKIVVGMVALVLSLTVGYALFSQSLNIGGTASADGTFELVFDSIGTIVEKGSTGAEASNSQDKKTLTITVPNLEYPGAYVQIPAVIKNTGTVDAKLLGITTEGLSNDDMVVTYTGLEQNDIIKSEEVRDIVITIKWKEASVTTSSSLSFNIGLNYEQVRVEDITTGSSESSFPVVEGQLGDNVYFKYDNGVINITGSGDMNYKECNIYGDSEACNLTAEITLKIMESINIKNQKVSDSIPFLLSAFIGGMNYEDFGMSKTDFKQQYLISSIGLTDEEANEAITILDSVPKLERIIFDNGITTIRERFFIGIKISELLIPNTINSITSNSSIVADDMFNGVNINTLYFEKGTTKIISNFVQGSEASIVNIVIPDGVTTIESNSIKINGYTTITIPQSVTTIEANAISGNYLTTIVNTTGRAFDWNLILTGTSGESFVTGTVEYDHRTITITDK